MIKRAFAAWLLLAVLMVLNGFIREIVYGPSIGAYPAHVVSTISGILVLFAVAYFFVRGAHITDHRRAWTTGAAWVAATVLFEFGLGFVRGVSLTEIMSAYDIRAGHVWPVFLLAEVAAPAFWVQHFRSRGARPDPRVHFPLIRLG